MNTKEFFLKTLKEERKKFRDVIEALPDDKFGHKVHERAREASSLAGQLAVQWTGISNVITKGNPMDGDWYKGGQSKAEMLEAFDKSFDQLLVDVENAKDEDWENGNSVLDMGKGGKWEDKKYNMAWGFFFDAIHHRGQLSTYLRAMGAKVPSIYGPSADTQ